MTGRRHIPRDIAADVVMLVRRRCCLCWHIEDRKDARPGQIAHLNRNRDDHRLSNLVWLCLEHHSAYDSRTSQSKNYMELEVRRYRDRLIEDMGQAIPDPANDSASHEIPEPAASAFPTVADSYWRRPWRFPLYQIADQPEFFAYTAHGSDGVCLIERIDLPDDRIVIVCIDVAGNPGTSITNAAERIADQVCARFGIAPARLVWLEHYADAEPHEWRSVSFTFIAGQGFSDPVWTTMTRALWQQLGLSPRNVLPNDGYHLSSPLVKRFPWPPIDGEALLNTDEDDEA